MLLLGILAMNGLGTDTPTMNGNFTLNYIREEAAQGNIDFYLYDDNGNPKCFINGTGLGDGGSLIQITGPYPPPTAGWLNATSQYELYYDTAHYCPVNWYERNGEVFIPNNGRMDNAGSGQFNLASSLGFIALIVAIMAVGTIAGITILGSGEKEFSVRLLTLGAAFLTFWGILTFMSYPLILEGGFYVFLAYFVLTAMYALGFIMEIGN